MSTHAADCGVCDFTWRHVPAADHKPAEKRKLYHIDQIRTWPPAEGGKWAMVLKDPAGVEIPQVAHTYGYHHAVFGYMNDQQLAIAESTIGNVRKLDNPTPTPATNITMLTLLAMERCRTAREAIRLMGALAEEYGYGYNDGGEMLAVSDPSGDLGLRDHAGRPPVDPAVGQARRGLGGPARARRPRRGLSQRIAHRRDRPRQPRLFHGLGPRRDRSPSRPASTIPRAASRSTGRGPTRPAEGSACEHAGPPLPDVALLRPRRPVEEIQGRDAQHGLPLLGQARREALARGRHAPDPGQVRGHGLRPGPGPARRPVQESQLFQGDPPDQRAQRQVLKKVVGVFVLTLAIRN
ncbi:MAG: C69 family dipeptidase [Candidatus Moduliflexus flocculans]|nr:C69 family dipeptidase [Candidatus Moduliflexus flocculans]